MKYTKQIVSTTLIAFCLYGCTAFKKNIEKPVVVAMPDRNVPVNFNSTALNAKYINNLSKEDIAEHFLKGFDSEAKTTKNVTLKTDESGADFIVRIIAVNINESSKIEKIADEKSPYNGQDMVLNTIECAAELEITDAKDKTKKYSHCYNTKSRSEKLKNNRDLNDLISGTNKDHTSYRTKLLDDSISVNLSQDVGRRVWVPITRRIS
ncbi:MAG: hypothetical protein ABIP51_11660, partial [Bacteroidia bacterium]